MDHFLDLAGLQKYTTKILEVVRDLKSESSEVYDTSEKRIGTWLGKPLYRLIIPFTTPKDSNYAAVASVENDKYVTRIDGHIIYNSKQHMNVNFTDTTVSPSGGIWTWYRRGEIMMHASNAKYFNLPGYLILEYTKTTDSETFSVSSVASNASTF